MKNSETNTPGNSLATSEFRLLRRHQIALEGVLRLQREVEQKAEEEKKPAAKKTAAKKPAAKKTAAKKTEEKSAE